MPTATRKKPSRLTDAQLEEMLALTKHADSVEFKLTVPDTQRRATVAALGMDPWTPQIRQVFFTPDLRLNQRGVVVRARRVQGRGAARCAGHAMAGLLALALLYGFGTAGQPLDVSAHWSSPADCPASAWRRDPCPLGSPACPSS